MPLATTSHWKGISIQSVDFQIKIYNIASILSPNEDGGDLLLV